MICKGVQQTLSKFYSFTSFYGAMAMQSPLSQESTWQAIARLLRWDKPTGRLILMVPALWGVFLGADGRPPLPLVGAIIIGSLITSAAGCVVNDLWDRNIDPQVERTRSRPLASRALSVRVGIAIAFVAFACAAVLAAYLNPITWWLSVAAVPVIIGYPLAKRFFPVPQLVLSLAWGFAVLISWSAASCSAEGASLGSCLGRDTYLLWGATVLWTLGFDTVYAMPDREDDRRIGVNSSALFFGDRVADAVGLFFLGTSLLLAAMGILRPLTLPFWPTWAISSVGWAWQYQQLRARPIHPKSLYAKIFRHNVALGFLLLAGMIAGSLLVG